MRLLHLPNENIEGDQIGPRQAFTLLKKQGVLSAYAAYSYLVRAKVLDNHGAALEDCYQQAKTFAPDVIFTQHVNDGYPVNSEFLRKLKSLPSRPKLVVHEGDAYGRFIKRPDKTIKTLFAESDMSILVGTGYLADMARKAGARRVRFAPHSYDSQRFGLPWNPTLTRRFDAVMIANLPCIKRVPGLYMPGGRERKQTAQAMYRALGHRFVVFGGGQGWRGQAYASGTLPFDQQGATIRDAWMSVNWHQFDDIAMYASDRLSISLACGVPHITNYQPGYEHVFGAIPGLFLISTPHEAADVAAYLLSLPAERRNELGFGAAEYARQHLEATVVYAAMVQVINEELFGNPARGIKSKCENSAIEDVKAA